MTEEDYVLDNYKGITYDKCLQILKVLNVKRK